MPYPEIHIDTSKRLLKIGIIIHNVVPYCADGYFLNTPFDRLVSKHAEHKETNQKLPFKKAIFSAFNFHFESTVSTSDSKNKEVYVCH